ncbi:2-amino-4-deoxychorismate dehydrogenase [Sporomusa silvacetica DSM 10669]|uniref:2-amino-4-deoxychorismate dehydrogenase n=1 Tax=Sporomusa silvacetica DSM 10669 TaxID=1123289 RepID=A0ABZ3ITU6_9FIRM|nr:flavodoxin family protein [Sporomusa silvacetica]OZC19536.1 2-amino-4-deoxychorismate dehydrogenase [Sporomusa silvacetica DSM 10669]
MKVVAINGSPRKEGNTYHALSVIGEQVNQAGIDFEIIHIGNKIVRGCTACMGCKRNKNQKCVITTDEVNNWIQKMKEADGILIGSPVHFAGIAGTMKAFLDRVFEVASVNNFMFRNKVGAAVVAVRRSGGVFTFDALNHYLMYSEMIISSSNYWNVTHGLEQGEASQDGEGNQIMRVLGKNMAWLLKVLAAGKDSVDPVVMEEKEVTNFIR